MTPEDKKPGAATDAKPEVYAIQRGRSGWALSRRSLFTAAAAAAAAVAPERARAAVCSADERAHGSGYKDAWVFGVAIAPDGRLLVSGGADGKVKLWSLPDGALLRALNHGDIVVAVAISPDGRLLVSASRTFEGNGVKLWSLPDGALLKTLNTFAMAVAISPDGQLLVTGDSGVGTNLWSLPDGNLLKNLDSYWTAAAAFSPDGRMLVTGYWDGGIIRLWSMPGGELLDSPPGNQTAVGSIAISRDGRLMASAGYDATVKLWSLPDGALFRALNVDAHARAVAISPDGRLLAVGTDSSLTLWSLPEGALLKTLPYSSSGISGVWMASISPDGRLLVAGYGSIGLWSLPDGKQLPICPMDLESSPYSSATQYTMNGSPYTVQCGTRLPTGAVCTCNCITGCGCVSVGGGCGLVYWYPN